MKHKNLSELEQSQEEESTDTTHASGDIESILAEVNQNIEDDEEEEIPAPRKPKSAKKPEPVRHSLKDLRIDLNSINIRREDNPLEIYENIKAIVTKPTFEVIALQSAYRASLNSLNNDDLLKIRKISGSDFEVNKKLLTFVFNRIDSSSLGKISFDDWLRVTAESDFDTLVYGIYCATYPKESDYNVKCPKCGHLNKVKLSKENLIKVLDERIYALVHSIIGRKLSSQELIKESSVNYKKRVMLDDSKVICDLITPTLKDMLDTFNISSSYREVESELFGYIKHTSAIMVPDVSQYEKSGNLQFIDIDNIDEKLNIIKNLSPSDLKQLETEITSKLGEYKVSYKLPGISCASAKCGYEIKDISVDMVEVLFRKLAEG